MPSATARPHLVTPTSFNDAQEVGDRFKRRDPVVINLQGLDRDLARRLLDFASGVTYALGGHVERIASHWACRNSGSLEVTSRAKRWTNGPPANPSGPVDHSAVAAESASSMRPWASRIRTAASGRAGGSGTGEVGVDPDTGAIVSGDATEGSDPEQAAEALRSNR